jgi:hypothetical protein
MPSVEVLGFGGQAHRLAVERVGQAVVCCNVQRLDGAVGPALAGAGEQVGCPRHGLLAAGDHHGGVAGADHPGRVDHGRQPGQADLVDGHRGDIPADAGADGALPCRVLPGTGLQHLAHDDGLHLIGVHSAGIECCLDGVRAELDGGEARQLPVEPALRRARC